MRHNITTLGSLLSRRGAGSIVCAIALAALWHLLAAPGRQPNTPQPRGQAFAIVVGIEHYPGSTIQDALGARQDAIEFDQYAGSHGLLLDARNVLYLEEPLATKANVTGAIERVLAKAGAGDTVYLFLSARGITEQYTHRGFLLVEETTAGDYAGTALSTEWLLKTFQASFHAGQIFLFADLCHDPGANNEIHARLAELGSETPVKGILASQPNRASLLVEGANPPAGLFSDVLVQVLRARGPALVSPDDAVYNSVRSEVTRRSKNRQTPLKVAGLSAPPVPATSRSPAFWRGRIELATAGIPDFAAFFFPQAAPQWEDLRRQFQQALAQDRLIEPGGALDIFRRYRALAPPDIVDDDRRTLSTVMEDGAQAIAATYGAGEEFPNDPLRKTEADFEKAATLFQSVAELDSTRADASARQWFCRGRASLMAGDWPGAQSQFERALTFSTDFPEPYNGLGVSFLQQPSLPDHRSRASDSFQAAIDRAPEWSYPRHNLALDLIDAGNYRAAEQQYREAFRSAPYHPYLSYDLGLLLQRQNRLKEAEAAYRAAQTQLVAKIADQQAAAARYARILGGGAAAPGLRARYQQNLDDTNKMIQALTENQAEAANALGTVREQRGNRAAAAEEYKRAFGLNAKLLAARHNLAMMDMEIYRKSPKKPKGQAAIVEARTMWEANLAIQKDDRPSLMGVAGVYREQNLLPRSIAIYRGLVQDDRTFVLAQTQLALALAAAKDPAAEGELQKAIAMQQAAQKTDFAAADLHEALGNLYRGSHPADACGQYALARKALDAVGAKPSGALRSALRSCRAVKK